MLNATLNLIFPKNCLACRGIILENEHLLCTKCLLRLPIQKNSGTTNEAAKVLKHRLPIDDAFFLLHFEKGEITQNLLHAIKYKNEKKLALYLGKLLGNLLRNEGVSADYLVPVPLHPKKLKQRGYNQSLLLAEGIKDITGIPILNHCLIRTHNNVSQTRKNRVSRILNIDHSFDIQESQEITEKRLLLVDDVLTTGATAESCFKALMKGRPSSIGMIFLAMTV